jgi:hypothetical protein
MIAATNSWIVAFDNLSGIKPDLADALCSLATGGGFSTRELYTDADEKLFDAMRPIIVNGIEDVATRSDLLDRALVLTLPTIADEHRQAEEQLWQRFEAVRPSVLGALLDAVSAALRNLPSVRLDCMPRMADFALWATAAESGLGWASGTFLAAYHGNRGQANETALEASIIALPILQLLAGRGSWQGTAHDLLDDLEAQHTDDKTRKRREWPTTPRKLSGDLRRLAPNLRRAGIDVTFGRDSDKRRRRTIQLEQRRKGPSAPSVPAGTAEKPPCNVGRSPDGTDGIGHDGTPYRPAGNRTNSATSDGADGADGELQEFSNCADSDEEIAEWTA